MTTEQTTLFQLSKADIDEFTHMSQFYKNIGFCGIMIGTIVCFFSTILLLSSFIRVAFFRYAQYLSFESVPYFLYIIGIITSVVFVLASAKLNRLGYELKKAINEKNQDDFDEVLEGLSKYFETYGLIIVAVSISIFIIIIKSLNFSNNGYNESF